MNNCKQCQSPFEITEEDLAFYDRVSPVFGGKKFQVPPPTLCPDCRKQRRLAWRNERSLYPGACDATGKKIVSLYCPGSPYTVYGNDYWWSDQWSGLDYGRDFDFSRPFFPQFRELQLKTPRLSLFNGFSENSDYSNHASKNKNCYLVFATFHSENVHYSRMVKGSRDCIDCISCVEKCELCYECIQCEACYGLKFSMYSKQCRDSFFLYDCTNCSDCYRCSGLRNRQFCFENRQLTPEEYKKKVPATFSSEILEQEKEKFRAFLKKAIHPANHFINCEDCTGEDLIGCHHCTESYDLQFGEHSKYFEMGAYVKDVYDCCGAGQPGELLYEIHGMLNGYQSMACNASYNNSFLYYCDNCQNSKNLFGCVSLHHKEYCILNKQFTKEEYERLVPQIIERMSKAGEWGEFFPIALSPFSYNETCAQESFPLTREKALERGYPWLNYEPPAPKVEKIIPAKSLPDRIEDIPDDVLNWAIRCEVTGKPFKLIPYELKFYRNLNLPLPRRHPEQRHKDRLAHRNPYKLWDRNCAKCGKAIRTTYAPERPEIVYCEECYLKTVY